MSTTRESTDDVQSQASYRHMGLPKMRNNKVTQAGQREETKSAQTINIVKQNKKAKFAPRIITMEDFEEKKAFIKKR